MNKAIALIIPVAAFVFAAAAVQSAHAESGDGDAKRGKKLYYDHACYSCHGYNGETGVRDLVGTASPVIANADAFVAFLRLRGDMLPVFPSTSMPSYPVAALPDADALDILAYIRTFELDAPDIEDVPVLQAILESAEGQ